MSIHITKRAALIVAGAVLALAILLGAGKAYSSSEANSREASTTRLMLAERDKALATQKAEMDKARIAAVRQAAKDARASQKRHDRSVIRRAVRRQKRAATKKAEEAYRNGTSQGYSSGSADGHEAGVRDGIVQGSDELVCSDDMDVPLPACSW